jgi:hypothetical protein
VKGALVICGTNAIGGCISAMSEGIRQFDSALRTSETDDFQSL